MLLPSVRSRKKTASSGGFSRELAADGVFNFGSLTAVVGGKLVHAFTCFIASRDYSGGNPGAGKHGPAKRYGGIDANDFRLLQAGVPVQVPREYIQAHGLPGGSRSMRFRCASRTSRMASWPFSE